MTNIAAADWCVTAERIAGRVQDHDREFCWRLVNIPPDLWTASMRSLFELLCVSLPDVTITQRSASPLPPVIGDPYGDAARLERDMLRDAVPLVRVDRDGLLCISPVQPPECGPDRSGWRITGDTKKFLAWVVDQTVPLTASARMLLDTQHREETAEPEAPTIGGYVDHDPDRNVVTVVVDYDPRVTAALKEIRGAKWQAKQQRWEFPEREADRVATVADEWQWVVSDTARTLGERAGFVRHEALRMSKAVDADLHIPELNTDLRLRPFQVAGVAYAVAKRRTFIADEVGLGKTVSALAACSVTNRQRVLVVCQASLLENWEAEVRKWFPSWSAQIVRGRTRQLLPDARVVIIGYPVLAARWEDCNEWEPDALILDESHKCKTPGSLPQVDAAGRVTKKKKGTQVTAAAKAIAAPVRDRDGMVLLLSATPIQNKRYIEWWPQLEILGASSLFGDWTAFIKRYCEGRREFGHWVADGATNGEELHQVLRENCFVRRRKADVLDELPPWESVPVWLPFSTDGAKKYRHAEDDIVGFLEERARQIASELGENTDRAAWIARIRAESAEHLVKVNALRRLSGEAKLPAVMEWVDEFLLDPDKKLVVFAHHREIQAALLAAWQQPYQAAAILTPDEQRNIGESAEVSKARFQNDEGCRVVVCGPGAKEGHTLTAADTVLVTELPWVPTDLTQMIGRSWGRLSDLHGAQLVVPLGGPEGSIDHRMWQLLDTKMKSVDAATDGIVADDSGPDASVLQDLVLDWSNQA